MLMLVFVMKPPTTGSTRYDTLFPYTTLFRSAMHLAAQRLGGHHDFTTFRSVQCQSDSPVKTLDRLDVQRMGEEIAIFAEARSFLHHQVRSMVGCLSLVGRGTWSADDLDAALRARHRRAVGLHPPPDGLHSLAAPPPLYAP